MRRFTYYLALALSAIAISCGNDEPAAILDGDPSFQQPESGEIKYIEIPSEGYEETYNGGTQHVSFYSEFHGKNIEYDREIYDYHIDQIFPDEYPYESYREEERALVASGCSAEEFYNLRKKWRSHFTIDNVHYAPNYMDFYPDGSFDPTEREKITAVHNDYITAYTEGERNETLCLKIGKADKERYLTFIICFADENVYEIFKNFNIISGDRTVLHFHQAGPK